MEEAIVYLSIAVVVLIISVAVNSYAYKKRRENLIGIIVDYVDEEKLQKIAERLNEKEQKIFLQFLGERQLGKKEE